MNGRLSIIGDKATKMIGMVRFFYSNWKHIVLNIDASCIYGFLGLVWFVLERRVLPRCHIWMFFPYKFCLYDRALESNVSMLINTTIFDYPTINANNNKKISDGWRIFRIKKFRILDVNYGSLFLLDEYLLRLFIFRICFSNLSSFKWIGMAGPHV